MALINWTDGLSVKVESIDNQHKKLIDMINEFYELIREKSNNDLIANLVKNMKDYTINHFSYEERLLEKHGYVETVNHKQEHAQFINKVEDLEKRLNNGQIIVSFEITSFLKKWLCEHIQVSDMKYSGFLVKAGVR